MKSKQWPCRKCGAILGMISYNGQDVPQLELLRTPIDLSIEMPAQVDVFGALVGRMPIVCSECGTVNVWEVSVDAMVYLLSLLSDEQMFQLWMRLLGRSRKSNPQISQITQIRKGE